MSEEKNSGFFKKFSIKTYHQARRIIRIIFGLTLLLIGLLMIVLPGPATVVIPLALGLLASEFFWAKWVLAKFNRTILSVLEFNSKRKARKKRHK